MKKFMKILIVGVMCVSLAGCGNMTNTSTGSNAENSVVTPSPEPTKKETQKYKVGDVMYFAGDGIKYSVTIKKWGTSMDGSLMDLYSWKVYTYFNYEIENIGDNEAIINDDSIFSVYADDYAVETKWNEDTKIAEKLAPGRKITGKIYANFNADDAKNVELQVHDSIVLIKDENTEGQQEDSEDNEVDSTSTPDTTTDYEESSSDDDSYEESSSDDDDEYILSYSSDRLLTVSDGVGVAAVDWNGVSEKKKRVIDKTTSSIAKKIIHNSGNVKPGIKTKGMFWVMHIMQKNGFNPRDVEHWKSKGWTEKKRPWK